LDRGALPASLGFYPAETGRRAFEQKSEEIRQWLEVKYPKIRQAAKREKTQIYWGDEMGLRSDHAVGRSYGRRGQTPVIAGTGSRFGCHLISAITNLGRLNFLVSKKRFKGRCFWNSSRRLVHQSSRKVYLIVDRHLIHRSRKIKNWFEEKAQ
jgi:diphthamide synthase subunit DPH2